jgi:serine/threonine-protein kinase
MATDPRTTVFTHARARTRAQTARPPQSPRVGDVLGAYRLCAEIGGGGMATVYLARTSSHVGLQRFVALKCIRPELAANERFIDMFLTEARIATQIHHANVCTVFDFDRDHGTYYLAMEFLVGRTLTAIQRRLADVPDRCDAATCAAMFARVLEGACEGLHAAHEATSSAGEPLHVVHRDVSPDNLFVTFDGTVKVMDFGVASTAETQQITRTGVLKGKCAYLAPEVIAGAKADRRADVWGLGVVAWEMIAQRALFDAPNDAAMLRAIAERDIPPVSTVRPGVPSLVDEILARALERDPAKRYQTARELGRMLSRFLVEQRRVVGLADIAELVRELFPDGVGCGRELVRFAEQLDAPPTPRARDPWRHVATVADPQVAAELARRSAPTAAGTPSERVATAVAPESRPTQGLRALRSRWLGWSLRVALVALAFVLGSVVACHAVRMTEPLAPASDFTLEATPAGVDANGAVLLRVNVVRKR